MSGTMTISEAMKMGVTAVTREPWKSHNQYCRLELPVFPGNEHPGVWARLIDPFSNLTLKEPSEKGIPIILMAGVNDPFNADPEEGGVWEEWVEPEDYARRLGKRWSWATGDYAHPEAFSLAYSKAVDTEGGGD